MKCVLTAAATLAALLVPAAGSSAQCATTTFIEIDVPGVGTFYYEEREAGSFYIYGESNGREGLQRGGGNIVERTTGIDLPPPFDDPCLESDGPGDLIIGKSCARVPVFYGEAPTCLSG